MNMFKILSASIRKWESSTKEWTSISSKSKKCRVISIT